jgi:hypothetical protein
MVTTFLKISPIPLSATHSKLSLPFIDNFDNSIISLSIIFPKLENIKFKKIWTNSRLKVIPLEVIHLILGLGKPSAMHSSLMSSPAFARISFGSLIQIGGTETSFSI